MGCYMECLIELLNYSNLDFKFKYKINKIQFDQA